MDKKKLITEEELDMVNGGGFWSNAKDKIGTTGKTVISSVSYVCAKCGKSYITTTTAENAQYINLGMHICSSCKAQL